MDKNSLHVKRKNFKAGEIIFNEGDIRDNAYIIDKGKVDIIRGQGGKASKFATLTIGDLFGEMALMEPGLRSASAIATEECSTFVISSNVLEDRLKGLDPVVTSMFNMLIERYRFSRIEKDKEVDDSNDHASNQSATSKILNDFSKRKAVALKELGLEQEIRYALYKDHFKPYLQPIVSLSDRRIVGFETLIRWHHPERGIIMPDEFIPAAERVNLIQAIDRKMLEKACEILPEIHKMVSDQNKPFISVNLSGVNFEDDSMVLGISDVFKNSQIDPKHIKLEITESAFIGNADKASKILDGLKALGVTISLDDFGVGYSSLGYLHKFAIDGIKIDRSFTARARDNKKSMDIVSAIVGLAKTFDLGVIAEGIETQEDADSLMKIGCIEGQGYLYSKPLTVEDAMKILA